MLYLIEILHQTTTFVLPMRRGIRCILSKFYIKPQLFMTMTFSNEVVSYRNSTSNHNAGGSKKRGCAVVSYRNSTSNHNSSECRTGCKVLYLIEILHQTTTPDARVKAVPCCILSKFYIKPQRIPSAGRRLPGCILSKFYIKPQLFGFPPQRPYRCILSKFYIKPQQPKMFVERK